MTIDIEELRRLAQAATPGPWKCEDAGFKWIVSKHGGGYISREVCKLDGSTMSAFRQKENGPFIAAANPTTISELIDRIEAAERNLGCCRAEREEAASLFLSVKAKLIGERDALRAELAQLHKEADKFGDGVDWIQRALQAEAQIEQMEQQEPVATIHINSITGNPSVDFIPGHRYLHHNSSLYALPGAKEQEPTRDWWDCLIADISAIGCMHRGSPTYAHDAYWMRDHVVRMLEQRRDALPGAIVRAATEIGRNMK